MYCVSRRAKGAHTPVIFFHHVGGNFDPFALARATPLEIHVKSAPHMARLPACAHRLGHSQPRYRAIRHGRFVEHMPVGRAV
jgi:hypothetical protein